MLAEADLTADTPEDQARLMVEARAAKEALSIEEIVTAEIELSSGSLDLSLNRDQFEACTAALTARTMSAGAQGAA